MPVWYGSTCTVVKKPTCSLGREASVELLNYLRVLQELVKGSSYDTISVCRPTIVNPPSSTGQEPPRNGHSRPTGHGTIDGAEPDTSGITAIGGGTGGALGLKPPQCLGPLSVTLTKD